MADKSLGALLARARAHTMTAQERREQGLSLVVGNAAVEGTPLHRGTVTLVAPRGSSDQRSTIATTVALEPPNVPFEVEGAVRQFGLVTDLVELHLNGEKVEISGDLIKALHAAAGDTTNPHFGAFRTLKVELRGSSHQPPPPADLENAVASFCDELADRWEAENPFALSAYALWRLNWIHPFVDGNGRTARALCYLVLNLKLGSLLPGSPTLLEQLAERREEYFDALTVADLTLERVGVPDLMPLQVLLTDLLERQLRSLPALSEDDEDRLGAIVARRIGQLDPAQREDLFGANTLFHRAWSVGDHFLVHVGSREALDQAEELHSVTGRPFPGLLAGPHERAQISVTNKQRGAIVREREFTVIEEACLWLEPNAAVTLERPAVLLEQVGSPSLAWRLEGALYVLRRGNEITDLWWPEVFELLVTRHIDGAR